MLSLYDFFKLQRKLMDELDIHATFSKSDKFELERAILEASGGILEEAVEAHKEFSVLWKKWEKFNREAALEELADVFFFLLELLIILEYTPEDFCQAFKNKWEKNIIRIQTGKKEGK